MEKFSFNNLLDTQEEKTKQKKNEIENKALGEEEFYKLCASVKSKFYDEWESRESSRANLDIQKRAIIGYTKEKEYFKSRISEIIESNGFANSFYPPWYENLIDAIYSENWGFAGISEWFKEEYKTSSSAKIIEDRIYFMIDGKMVLMPQRISENRKVQLIKAFLLYTPEERQDKAYHEVYLLDGTRVTIFTEPLAKKGQSSIVFRRYLIPDLSFEEQAKRGTIPKDSINFFKAMVAVGYNVVFTGAVRTAKTTFLNTWQSYEDKSLEGVMVETDPEIPMEKLLPDAPVMQLIADGMDLKNISKNLLRSDADYFILAEARDGIALDTAVRIANKGTKRMKMTFHSRRPDRFPLEAATEIVKSTGGDINLTMNMVAASFDFVFHFIQLKNKNEKRLKSVYQMNLNADGQIMMDPLCKYDSETDSWQFFNNIGKAQEEYGLESDSISFKQMKKELEALSKKHE